MLMIAPDIKDLMTRIFIASCYGALNATMVIMVMANGNAIDDSFNIV